MGARMRIAAVLTACALASTIGACVGTGRAAGSAAPRELSGIVTMGECLSARSASFETFDKGIRSGEGVPESLRLFVAQGPDGRCHDRDVIVRMWKELCDLQIDADHPKSLTIEDGSISFSFDSGSESVRFAFETSEYTEYADGMLVPVEDPATVRRLVEELAGLLEDETEGAESVAVEELEPHEEYGGAYLWDADGDGDREQLWVGFVDNGDEARDVMTFSLWGSPDGDIEGYEGSEAMDARASLEGGYELEKVTLVEDGQGSYLLIDYLAGDHYRHDRPARCTLRLVGDELEVEEL